MAARPVPAMRRPLSGAANAAGAATLNLQHGLDNSGLTYGTPHGHKTAQFSARFVLTWGGFERLTVAAMPNPREGRSRSAVRSGG